jgi:general secretion pathway protein M
MNQIKEWFDGLESNEQKIVLIGASLAAVMMLIFGLLKPLGDAVDDLQVQVASRQSSVDHWKASLPLVVANRGTSQASAGERPLSNVVTSTTRSFQLKVSRVQEKSPGEIQVWFDNIPFNDFIRWVAELENKHQISVDSVNIRSKDRDGLSSIDIKIVRG